MSKPSLHDAFEPNYINMGRNGIDPIGHITDAECGYVCTAPDNVAADLIVDALNRDASGTAAILALLEAERAELWINFHTPAAQKAADELLTRIKSAILKDETGS